MGGRRPDAYTQSAILKASTFALRFFRILPEAEVVVGALAIDMYECAAHLASSISGYRKRLLINTMNTQKIGSRPCLLPELRLQLSINDSLCVRQSLGGIVQEIKHFLWIVGV
jgi:hypothetical protein